MFLLYKCTAVCSLLFENLRSKKFTVENRNFIMESKENEKFENKNLNKKSEFNHPSSIPHEEIVRTVKSFAC